MPQWLPVLILIFAFILLADAVGSFVLWKTTKNRLFLKASIAWSANFFNFIGHGAAQNHAQMTLVAHSFYFITACYLTSILCELNEMQINLKKYISAGAIMLASSLIMYELTNNYFISALILDLFIAYPMITKAAIVLKNKTADGLIKAFAFLLILNGFHFLDYPFLHDSPKGSIFGFSAAFLISICFSILLPTLILQTRSKKYTLELERVVKERTLKLFERTTELEEINKENATLLSIVCHDIATPISITNFVTKKLKSKFGQDQESEAFKQILKIDNNLNTVLEILKSVREMHAMKLGKIEPHLQPIAIKPLISEVCSMFEPRCEEKKINLTYKFIDGSENTEVLIDPILFKNQILTNLLSNAIKFSEIGKNIQIVVKKNHMDVKILIIDNGIGISDDKVDRIFEINKETTTLGTNSEIGTGLGLPMVKMITEKMGGTIHVRNNMSDNTMSEFLPAEEKSSGTTFYLGFKIAA